MTQPPSPPPFFRAFELHHGVKVPLDDLIEGHVFHATSVAYESVEKFHLGAAELLLRSVGSRILGSAPGKDGFVRVASLGHRCTQVQPLNLRLVRGDVLCARFVNLPRGWTPQVRHVLHVTGHVSDPAPPPPVLPLAQPPSTAEPVPRAAAPPSDEDDDLKLDEEQEEALAEARAAAAAGKIV